MSSHVNLFIDINTRNDEEHSRTPSSSSHQPAQPEDDGPLVLLDHLHHQEQGEGEGDEDEEDRGESDHVGAEAGALAAVCSGRRERSLISCLVQQRSPDRERTVLTTLPRQERSHPWLRTDAGLVSPHRRLSTSPGTTVSRPGDTQIICLEIFDLFFTGLQGSRMRGGVTQRKNMNRLVLKV